MLERRSSRSKKQVDYSKFADLGGDDDDFADSTPPLPPSKKSRLSNKENKLKAKSRLSPEAKYDEQLHVALELSLNESQDKINPDVTNSATNTSDVVCMIGEPVKDCTRAAKPILNEPDDDIEIIGSVPVTEEQPAKRRKIGQTVSKTDDFQPDSNEDFNDSEIGDESDESDESDEDYDDNDSDFDDLGKKNKKYKSKALKGKGHKKATNSSKAKTAPISVPVKSKVSVTPKQAARFLCTPIVSSPLTGDSPSSIGLKRTAEGSASSVRSPIVGVAIKSPSSIRLGLSRNQKVKPLHPLVKIQH